MALFEMTILMATPRKYTRDIKKFLAGICQLSLAAPIPWRARCTLSHQSGATTGDLAYSRNRDHMSLNENGET
jgi:hypothetical protein